MMIAGLGGKLNHLKRAAQIDVQTAFLGFAIERGRAMNHRVRRLNQPRVLVVSHSEFRARDIAKENADARLKEALELVEVHVQLEGAPQPLPRFLKVARAHKKIERIGMIREQICGNVGADIARRTRQEDRHYFSTLTRLARSAFRSNRNTLRPNR